MELLSSRPVFSGTFPWSNPGMSPKKTGDIVNNGNLKNGKTTIAAQDSLHGACIQDPVAKEYGRCGSRHRTVPSFHRRGIYGQQTGMNQETGKQRARLMVR